MEIFGIAVGIFAGIITYLTWRNGRWMKQAHEDMIALLERIELGQKETREELVEIRKEMAEARKEMAEAIKYVADLIVSESEKTRQVVKSLS